MSDELTIPATTSTIYASKDFVLEQARLTIAAVRENPEFVEQAKQINSALSAIVAMERNCVMHEALQKSLNRDRGE